MHKLIARLTIPKLEIVIHAAEPLTGARLPTGRVAALFQQLPAEWCVETIVAIDRLIDALRTSVPRKELGGL